MGATLRYAKVIDVDRFTQQGGQIRPGLDCEVRLSGPPPAVAAPFVIARSWVGDHAFTETWRIVDPHGRTLREGAPREVLETESDIHDEIADLALEFADQGFAVVFDIDGREVARCAFDVLEPQPAE